jgi:PAS domain S-box-containing protein
MDQKPATMETAASSAPGDRRATILIVEDSPVQAELLRRDLDEAGYRVIVAGDGAEGLALAKANHPAAVVSDINMPVMDGYAMCQAIRREDSLKATPVILLTMLSDAEDVIRGLEVGADAYVTKPYNILSLVARVASLLAFPPPAPPGVERRKVEMQLHGVTHLVDAHGPRMLNLLISTYENAVLQNRELVATQQALEDLNRKLEQKVEEKTAAITASETRYRRLFEAARDGILLLDVQSGQIVDVNPFMIELLGYTREQYLGKKLWEIGPFKDTAAAKAAFDELQKNKYVRYENLPLRTTDGRDIDVEFVSHAYRVNGGEMIQCNIRDITERKRAEQELRRLNWALRALSLSNSALVHTGTEQELFQACCDAIAVTEVYPLAWIGRTIDDPAHSIEVAAAAGKEVKYMQDFEVSWGDTPQGNGPTGTAIRTGATQVANNLAESAAYLPWIERARTYGLASSISLPFHVNGTVMGVLTIYSSEVDAFNRPEVDLFEELAEDIGYGITSRRTLTERDHLQQEQLLGVVRLKNALIGTIGAVALTVEKRDPYTAGHQQRVAELCVAIGQELNFSEDRLEGLRLGATIHDLGKISIPAEILAKPIKLTAIEFMLIKNHAQAGFDILKDIKLPWPIATMVLQHHERQDGSGYPQGLKGEQILLESRILAVADVVEAMASHRPYRAALGIDLAVKEIERGRGTVYDAAVVDACIRLFTEKRFAFST